MEVSSWENHRTKWMILQQATLDYQRVVPINIPILGSSIPIHHHKFSLNHYRSGKDNRIYIPLFLCEHDPSAAQTSLSLAPSPMKRGCSSKACVNKKLGFGPYLHLEWVFLSSIRWEDSNISHGFVLTSGYGFKLGGMKRRGGRMAWLWFDL